MLTVVTGAPCSGKSTFVREHAKPGDLVVDFDALARALGSPVAHEHSPWACQVAATAWAEVVRLVMRRHDGERCWVVDSLPTPQRRWDYGLAGAELVTMRVADPAVLHQRADADGRPASTHGLIDSYLAAVASGGKWQPPRAR